MNRKTVIIKTEKQFTRLNELIEDFLKDKKGDGVVNVFTKHTTCAIKIIEGEILLLADINNFLDKLIPKENDYMHDKIEIREAACPDVVHIAAIPFSSSAIFFSTQSTVGFVKREYM